MEHQLTQGLLLDDKGNLNEAGFSFAPVKKYGRKQIKGLKWRIKEWDYYYVGNNKYGLCLTISDVSFLSLISITFMDFEKLIRPAKTSLKFFTFGKLNLPSSSKEGDVSYKDKKMEMGFYHKDGKRYLQASYKNFVDGKDLEAQIYLEETLKDSMTIATPFFKKKHFYYNQKINLMKASGFVKIGEEIYSFDNNDSFGLLDWGRGTWTYKNTWYWSNINGRSNGHNIGFNLGYGFGDTSASSENMFYYDDKAYKLEDVTFNIPKDKKEKDDFMSPWTLTSKSGDININFKPIINRHDDTNIGIIRSCQNQVFGYFSGYVLIDGKKMEFDNILGFAEKVYNRW